MTAITSLGGGHGLFATLRAVRRIADEVTAVVTVADDGGSFLGLQTGAEEYAPPR